MARNNIKKSSIPLFDFIVDLKVLLKTHGVSIKPDWTDYIVFESDSGELAVEHQITSDTCGVLLERMSNGEKDPGEATQQKR